MLSMSWVDVVIVLGCLASAGLGVWRGFMKEVLSLITWLAAIWLAWRFAWVIEPVLSQWVAAPELTLQSVECIGACATFTPMGIDADGPLPCDTSFITAFKNKNHDCIVGMYHDALQSGLKAFGFDRGVTVQGGLPIPITTPAHGTAFDIAGQNLANLEPTIQSFKIALTMAQNISNHD